MAPCRPARADEPFGCITLGSIEASEAGTLPMAFFGSSALGRRKTGLSSARRQGHLWWLEPHTEPMLKRITALAILAGLFGTVATASTIRSWDNTRSIFSGDDNPGAMAVDELGNTYVGGHSAFSSGGYKLWVTKFDPNGAFAGQRTYTTSTSVAFISAMRYDGNGHLYVSGYNQPTSGSNFDWLMMKIDTATMNFSSTWANTGAGTGIRTLAGPGASLDSATDLAIHPLTGGIFVTGTLNHKITTIQLTTTGTFSSAWADNGAGVGVRTLNLEGHGHAIGFDSSGFLYVGFRSVVGSDVDMGVLKYTSTGALSTTWANTGDGVGTRRFASTGTQYLNDMVVDPSGNVTICGSGTSWRILRYLANGSLSWNTTFGGTSGCFHLIRDASSIYALGYVNGSLGTLRVAQYSQATGQLSTWPDTGSGIGVRDLIADDATVGDLIFDSNHNVIASGGTFSSGVAQVFSVDAGGTLNTLDTMDHDFDNRTYILEPGLNGRFYGAGYRHDGVKENLLVSKYMAPNLFGNIRLGDYDAGADLSKIKVDVELRHSGLLFETYPAHLEPNGDYQLATERTGSGFLLGVKPSHWLRDTITGVALSASGVTVRQSRHTNGDVDGDNEVGAGDYAILSAVFGAAEGDPGFEVEADLNGDGAVDIGDYSILSQRYGRIGDD